MEKDKVPQDDAKLLNGLKEVCYATDKDGNYITVKSAGWDPKNEALKLAIESVNETVEEVRKKVLNNELSPLAYFMEKNMMDASLLSEYCGVSKKTIKKHLSPTDFKNASAKELEAYARALNITIEQLKQIH